MNCSNCGHDNRPKARFCEECATPLAQVCVHCSAVLRPTAKFCDECATPTGVSPRSASGPRLSPTPANPSALEPVDTRKVVTIVFADLVGSTALHERLEPETTRRFMESYYGAMRAAVESHGGTVTQLLGDGVKAVFGIPRVAEDDAIRAVRAAVAMQETFRGLAEQQRGSVGATGLRVAVNTGEVVANDASEIIGDPVNVAARLQEQGEDGDVVVGESTHRLVSTLVTLGLLGSFALKGRAEAVKAYRVLSLERPAGTATTPFVGRDGELSRLDHVFDTAIGKPAAGLAVLLGSPGLGKSRLIEEFARRHADHATVVHAHCVAEGAASFAPVAVALREQLRIDRGASEADLRAVVHAAIPGDEPDHDRIANGIVALLEGTSTSPEEAFFAVRRMLGTLAKKRPVVFVIDDLHWAEPLLLDLVEHLIQWGGGVPLLVLIGARPELRDLRSKLTTPGGLVSDVVTLTGLDAGAAMRHAANVIGANDLPAAIAAKVLATSEGNPLFVAELVRMLVDEGALTREGDRWTAGENLAALEMPPTVHALLAARIERLRPEERVLLERAAVVGRHFSRSAVAALLARQDDLDAQLETLQRSELIERDTGWLLGEPVLRFHHALIRDAAYRRLLKGTRAELHAKLADWFEARVGDAPEHDETIGWHLEQAHIFLAELGPLDASASLLGERAAARLSSAGRRALAGDDVPLAASLLGRAVECLEQGDETRADLALDWCEALLSIGDVTPAASAIAELGRFAVDSPRLTAWQACFAAQLSVLTQPEELQSAADTVATAAAQLTDLGDAAGEAKAHSVHAQALARLGRIGACEAALDLALAAARRAGDRRRANAVLAGAPIAALWGPSPVTRASGRCLDVVRVLRITQGAPAVESVALSCQGVLEALRGRTDAARRMIASSRKMVEELGIASRLFEADVFAARIETMEGETAAAERLLRGAYDGLRNLGLGIDAAIAGSLLARILLAQDRIEEAEALSHESEALAGDDLQAAFGWRGVRAEALAKRGEHIEAIALARVAVSIASATDALLYHADACMSLAAALRAAGRGDEARAEERRAIDLWEAKGATLLVERALRENPALAGAVSPAPTVSSAPTSGRRFVTPNHVTRYWADIEDAFASGNEAEIDASFANARVMDHTTGASYGSEDAAAAARRLRRSAGSTYRHEMLATLGQELGLVRGLITAKENAGRSMDVGAYEIEEIKIAQVDAQRRSEVEVFRPERLGDAIVRLYERYAESLPAGPDRVRAAATARSVAVVAPGGFDRDRYAEAFRPDVEIQDHRRVVGGGRMDRAQLLRSMSETREIADAVVSRAQEVLALTHDALLLRWLTSGVGRESGGAFEWGFLRLFVFDHEGRVARYELFEDDGVAEALTRFEALVGSSDATTRSRGVRRNTAIQSLERFANVLAERDRDGLESIFDGSLQVVHHPTGTTYGRREMIGVWRDAMKAARLEYRRESLASLGDHFALERHVVGTEGLTRDGFSDFGFMEIDEVGVCVTSDSGHWLHIDLYAPEYLGRAIARLYECFAEHTPEGPERDRAATAARVMNFLMVEPTSDYDDFETLVAPEFEGIDHRLMGTSMRGAKAYVDQLRAWTLVADDIRFCPSEVLALTSNAVLTRTMHSGSNLEFGGTYERPHLALFSTDAKGLLVRAEWFPEDSTDHALARFEAVVRGSAPRTGVRHAPRSNAATTAEARLTHALLARDWPTFEARLSEDLEAIDHRWHTSYGRDGVLRTVRGFMKPADARAHSEQVTSLGERLNLAHHMVSASGSQSGAFDVGEHATEFYQLIEVDDAGLIQRTEFFGTDALADALARLYALYALEHPEGPERESALAIARSVTVLNGPIDLNQYVEWFDPDFDCIDHRHLHTWSAVGAQEILLHYRAQLELAPDFALRDEEILAVAPNAFVVRRIYFGSSAETGGAFENPILLLQEFASNGRCVHSELWEVGPEAEALARFDELVGGALPADEHPFANAASRANHRRAQCFNTRDWDGMVACMAPDLVFDERRRLLHNTANREVWLEQTRLLFDVPDSCFTVELVATRGERLALHRHGFEGTVPGGGGPLALDDHLALHEVDTTGRITAIVLFDLEDERAAYMELDARFEAGEAREFPLARAGHVNSHRINEREWDAYASGLAADYVYRDHRLLGWGDRGNDKNSMLAIMKSTPDLAPDSHHRRNHVRMTARGLLRSTTLMGTHDGAAFENPLLEVHEVDDQGKMWRTDTYDIEDLERALARFAEIEPTAGLESPFANAATRLTDRFQEAWNARDWDAIEALLASDVRQIDRRDLMHMELGRAEHLESLRYSFEMASSRFSVAPLATRGDHFALARWHQALSDGEVGPSEIEYIAILEVNDRGELLSLTRFNADDLDEAYAELDERSNAHYETEFPLEVAGLRAFRSAIAARDWAAASRMMSADLVAEDHRLVGWGLLNGPEAFLRTIQEMVALAPDARTRTSHLRFARGATLANSMWQGTRDGGAFESAFILVTELDEAGVATRLDFFDSHQSERAFARFDEATASRTATPHRELVKPNLASAWLHRFQPAFNARDWNAIEDLIATDGLYEDRQRYSLVSGGRSVLMTSLEERTRSGARLERIQLIATAGDRLALQRVLWAGGADDGRFEIEFLVLQEVDETGRVVSSIDFDLSDRAAAFDALFEREAASGAEPIPGVVRELARAMNDHDMDRVRSILPEQVVIHDHRRTGYGRLEGTDAFVASVAAAIELSPDVRWDTLCSAAQGPHGCVMVNLRWGTNTEGGEYESPFVAVQYIKNGRFERGEMFEIEDLDEALAQFHAWPDPSKPGASISPTANQATRLIDRFEAAWHARDWATFEAMLAPDMRQSDRRDLMHLELDRDEHLESLRFSFGMDASRFSTEILATRGDHLALVRTCLALSDAEVGPSEIGFLAIWETKNDDELRMFTRFNEDAHDEAFAELNSRATALSANDRSSDRSASHEIVVPPNAASEWSDRFRPVFNARDWVAIEDLFSPVVHYEDRQRHSLASGGYDVTMASLRARAESGAMQEHSPLLATAGDRLALRRSLLAGGGENGRFETEFLIIQEVDDAGRVIASINFDVDDRAAAFDELYERHAASGVDLLPASVTRLARALNDHDLDRLRTILPEDVVVHDHRRTGYGRLEGVDAFIPSVVAAIELSADARWDILCCVALGAHGCLTVNLLWGTNAEGGEFESPFVALHHLRDGRHVRGEMFEVEDLDKALARFAELGGSADS